MNIVCRLLFFVMFPMLLQAQYERILKNPAVIWAAEIEMIYYLRPPLPSDSVEQNDIIFWKNFDPKNRVPYEGSEMLIAKILAAARSGAWPAWQFADESMNADKILDVFDEEPVKQFADTVRQLSVYEVSRRLDSRGLVVTFDPVTLEGEVKETSDTWDIATYYAIRARQLLYFDEKKGDFELFTYAIAPLVRLGRPEYDKAIGASRIIYFDHVPFWLKMPDFTKQKSRKQPNVNDPNIFWAAQIKTLGNSPELEKLRPLKDVKSPVMQVLLDRFRTDAKFKAYDTTDEPIPFEARHAMLFSSDTVAMFDPETYEAKTEIEKKELRAEDFPRLRLIQNWYWDDRQGQLVIDFQSFAPLYTIFRLFLRQIQYEQPLFYRRKK